MSAEPFNVARCPEHGLHGLRSECFVCGGPVEQVPVIPLERAEAAARRRAQAAPGIIGFNMFCAGVLVMNFLRSGLWVYGAGAAWCALIVVVVASRPPDLRPGDSRDDLYWHRGLECYISLDEFHWWHRLLRRIPDNTWALHHPCLRDVMARRGATFEEIAKAHQFWRDQRGA